MFQGTTDSELNTRQTVLFPQSFLTNPSKLYLCKIPTVITETLILCQPVLSAMKFLVAKKKFKSLSHADKNLIDNHLILPSTGAYSID
jgi:hypothetical protein